MVAKKRKVDNPKVDSIDELKSLLEMRRQASGDKPRKTEQDFINEYMSGLSGKVEREEYREYLTRMCLHIDTMSSVAGEWADDLADEKRMYPISTYAVELREYVQYLARLAFELLDRLAAEHGICQYRMSRDEIKKWIDDKKKEVK